MRLFQKGEPANEKYLKDHGSNRHAVQRPALCLSRQRDLRRTFQLLGLRPPGRGTEKQCKKSLVEAFHPAVSLQCGAGLRHSDESPGVGGLRPCGGLLRSPDGLQGLPHPSPGRYPHRGVFRPGARQHGFCRHGAIHQGQWHQVPQLRQHQFHSHPLLQPDVQNLPGHHRGL